MDITVRQDFIELCLRYTRGTISFLWLFSYTRKCIYAFTSILAGVFAGIQCPRKGEIASSAHDQFLLAICQYCASLYSDKGDLDACPIWVSSVHFAGFLLQYVQPHSLYLRFLLLKPNLMS